jgi:hypothetical protein
MQRAPLHCGGFPYGDESLLYVANDWHTAILPVYLRAFYQVGRPQLLEYTGYTHASIQKTGTRVCRMLTTVRRLALAFAACASLSWHDYTRQHVVVVSTVSRVNVCQLRRPAGSTLPPGAQQAGVRALGAHRAQHRAPGGAVHVDFP